MYSKNGGGQVVDSELKPLVMRAFDLKVKFVTPVLGSQPSRDVASEFLARKYAEKHEGESAGREHSGSLPEDEVRSLQEEVERGTTVFHRDGEGNPVLFDYQVKGFIKEAGRTFNGMGGVKNLRSKIDSYLFVRPRQIKLVVPDEGMSYLERPLRAMTMQGERVALAKSELLPEGTYFYCELVLVEPGPITIEMVRELLGYGRLKGLGQWRNGGYGSFEFELDGGG